MGAGRTSGPHWGRPTAVRGDRIVIGIVVLAACAWCGWASGLHRTTAAAEITWLVSLVAVILVDVVLWRGTKGGAAELAPRTCARAMAAAQPWGRWAGAQRGSALADSHRGARRVGDLRHRYRAAPIPPHDQRARPSVPSSERRPPPRLGTRRDRLRGRTLSVHRLTPTRHLLSSQIPSLGARSPWRWVHWELITAGRRCCCRRVRPLASHSGSPSLSLLSSSIWWPAIQKAAAQTPRNSFGSSPRRVTAHVGLIAGWGFAGYHLFAR